MIRVRSGILASSMRYNARLAFLGHLLKMEASRRSMNVARIAYARATTRTTRPGRPGILIGLGMVCRLSPCQRKSIA